MDAAALVVDEFGVAVVAAARPDGDAEASPFEADVRAVGCSGGESTRGRAAVIEVHADALGEVHEESKVLGLLPAVEEAEGLVAQDDGEHRARRRSILASGVARNCAGASLVA